MRTCSSATSPRASGASGPGAMRSRAAAPRSSRRSTGTTSTSSACRSRRCSTSSRTSSPEPFRALPDGHPSAMDQSQREQFEEALEKKDQEAAEREQRGKALAGPPDGGGGVDPDSQDILAHGREQDDRSSRAK